MVMSLNGLALSGGGARAAYQAGVLKVLAELAGKAPPPPFPIISAISGGAAGAAILAASAHDFPAAVAALTGFWAQCRCGDIYRGPNVSRLAAVWRTVIGAAGDSWLDARPAGLLFAARTDFGRIGAAIDTGALHALSLGAYGYASQQTVHFFQGRNDIEPWRDGTAVSAHVRLGAGHLAAAFAIPLAFPPVKVHREYFCDAAAAGRADAAAVRLGAERVLSIEADLFVGETQRRNTRLHSAVLLQAAVHAVVSSFEQGHAGVMPATMAERDIVRCSPSVPLSRIAQAHWNRLPAALRDALERIEEETAFQVGSLLLFEPPYLEALIDLGYRDGTARRDELQKFLA